MNASSDPETFPDHQASAPTDLLAVGHYQQAPDTQPQGGILQRGMQVVEVLTAGRGWVMHETGWVEVGPGDFLWHEEGESTIGRSDPANPYQCLAVCFQVPTQSRRPWPRFLFWQDLEKLAGFTREVVSLFADEGFPRQVLRHYLHAVFLREATSHIQRRETESLPPSIRKVIRFIDRNHQRPLPVGELAAVAGWSVPHLHARLSQTMRQTPHALIIARRLRAAREMLAGGREPLKQIAAECGFAHASALCHHFKKASGLTPAAFRKKTLPF